MKTFWFLLTFTALLWYLVVTVYVGYRGIADIKGMLKRLSTSQNAEQ
jgi:hypothetical protein